MISSDGYRQDTSIPSLIHMSYLYNPRNTDPSINGAFQKLMPFDKVHPPGTNNKEVV